jgi:hypothetical protein
MTPITVTHPTICGFKHFCDEKPYCRGSGWIRWVPGVAEDNVVVFPMGNAVITWGIYRERVFLATTNY